MHVVTEVIPEKQLTIITVSGELDFDELLTHVTSYYEHRITTKNLLIDFRNASAAENMSRKHIEAFSYLPLKYAHKRPVGKSAYVVRTQLGFGLARMQTAFVETEDSGLEVDAFMSMEEAMQWLEEGPT